MYDCMYIIYPYVSYTVCPFSPVQVGMGMIQSMRTACFVYIKSLDFLRKSWKFDEPGDKILENVWVRKQNVEVTHQIHSNTFKYYYVVARNGMERLGIHMPS